MEFLANLVFGLLAAIGSLFSSPLDYNLSGQGITQLDQWKSDGTNITQNVANKPIKLSGLTPGGCVQLTAANIATTTGSPCGSGSGGGAFPFTAGTNYGALTNSTSTPVWFSAGLQASSTSRLVDVFLTNASSTNLAALSQTTGCATFLGGGALVSTGVACGTGAGGGSFSFTPDSYSGTLVNATSTPLWFKGTTPFSVIASSTFATFASSTVLSTSNNAYFCTLVGTCNVGIGATTSPYALFTILASSTGTTNNTLFAIASSSAATTTSFLTLSNTNLLSVGNSGSNIFTIDGTTSTTTISNLSLGNLNFDINAGVVALASLPVDANAAASTTQSMSLMIGDLPILTVGAQANGKGSIFNVGVGIGTTSPMALLSIFNTQLASTTSNISFLIASSSAIATSTHFMIDNYGRVAIASSTVPYQGQLFTVGSSTVANTLEATTTIYFDSASTRGTCVVMKDSDGAGYSYLTVNNGVLAASTVPCQ